MRILLAEDDSVLADGLTRSLRQSGYATDCVMNGMEADSALSTQDFAEQGTLHPFFGWRCRGGGWVWLRSQRLSVAHEGKRQRRLAASSGESGAEEAAGPAAAACGSLIFSRQ